MDLVAHLRKHFEEGIELRRRMAETLPAQIARAGEALANGSSETMPALRAFAIEAEPSGARLRFEVNLDQSSGPTATAKKILETLLAIPPRAQAALSVTREATLLG